MGKKRPSATDAPARFNAYYETFFKERWTSLRQSMFEEHRQVAFSDHLLQPYYLDEASLLAANLLPVKPGDTVLDMCAAPGGKTLVLATKLAGTGSLISNDRSATRRARLRTVLEDHLPPEYRNNIIVTGHDASRWGLYEQEVYDHILLDAPCSSERHVLNDPQALDQWSAARPKRLAIQQFAMLAAALEAVRIGGTILYSTCAIAPVEDEQVIEKLFEKRKDRFELLRMDVPFAETCGYGSIILPDTAQGRGPLYFCHIRRLS